MSEISEELEAQRRLMFAKAIGILSRRVTSSIRQTLSAIEGPRLLEKVSKTSTALRIVSRPQPR